MLFAFRTRVVKNLVLLLRPVDPPLSAISFAFSIIRSIVNISPNTPLFIPNCSFEVFLTCCIYYVTYSQYLRYLLEFRAYGTILNSLQYIQHIYKIGVYLYLSLLYKRLYPTISTSNLYLFAHHLAAQPQHQ